MLKKYLIMNPTLECQQVLRQLLETEYERRRADNVAYSKRAFARSLKVNAITLSQFMKGNRQISRKIARTVLEGLEVEVLEQQRLLSLFERSPGVRASLAMNLSPEQRDSLTTLNDIAPAILSLMETADFRSDEEWIARRLRTETTRISKSVSQLLHHGFLERTQGGALIPTRAAGAVFALMPNSIAEVSPDPMKEPIEISAGYVSVNPERIPEAQEMVRKFHQKLVQFLQRGRRREVCYVGIQILRASNESPEMTPGNS